MAAVGNISIININDDDYNLKDDAVRKMVASEFDIAVTYAKGDKVIYNDKLYKAKQAHTGAWIAADFDEIKLTSIIEDINFQVSGEKLTISVD